MLTRNEQLCGMEKKIAYFVHFSVTYGLFYKSILFVKGINYSKNCTKYRGNVVIWGYIRNSIKLFLIMRIFDFIEA